MHKLFDVSEVDAAFKIVKVAQIKPDKIHT